LDVVALYGTWRILGCEAITQGAFLTLSESAFALGAYRLDTELDGKYFDARTQFIDMERETA
jgi:hypothetical protein